MTDALTEAADALQSERWRIMSNTEKMGDWTVVPGLIARCGTRVIHVSPFVVDDGAPAEEYPDWEARLRDLEREPRDVDRGHGASPITAIRDAGVQV